MQVAVLSIHKYAFPALSLFAVTALSGIILCFAGLIPLGYWHDEFNTFADLSQKGFYLYIWLTLHWIPRPLSNLFVVGYGALVLLLRAPLITPALSACWLILFASVILVPLYLFRRVAGWQKSAAVILALSLGCAFLLGHTVAEDFYWPMAAFAYLPTLAAVTALLWCLCFRDLERHAWQAVCSILLLIAVFCSELGSAFVASFTGFALIGTAIKRMIAARPQNRARFLQFSDAWLIVPSICSLWVFYSVAVGRAGTGKEFQALGDPLYHHNVFKILTGAVRIFVAEGLSSDGDAASGLWVKGLFFSGSCLTLINIMPDRSHVKPTLLLLCMTFACFATGIVTIAAALHEYGLLCCEHHLTMRLCFDFIALIAAAGCVAGLKSGRESIPGWAPGAAVVCLLAATAIPAYRAAPKLLSDYMRFDSLRAARMENQVAGNSSDKAMTYVVAAPGKVVGGWATSIGTYRFSSTTSVAELGILKLFHKESITFVPAGTNAR